MDILSNLKKGIFPFIIAFTALSVSASAAFYSVSGLSNLFAGASFEVIIMAGSLEVAKLVIASLLYQYWDTINKGLRAYLTVAAFILVIITSMGIYGFLSAAYQDTYRQLTIKNNKVAEFYKDDINADIDWLESEFKKCILIPTTMGQNFLGVSALIFNDNNQYEISSDVKNVLHTTLKLMWHISNYSNNDLMESILIESGRSKEKNENIFEVGALKLNKNKSEVLIDGNYVDLTKQEFNILELLATNKGDFVTPEEFLDKTWEKTNVSPAAVDIAMFRLRQKLSKYKKGSNLIKNKTGKGYLLNAS